LMILHTQKLALFNQRVLGGEILSQSAREDWLRTYSRVIVNLTARSEAPIVAYENLPPAPINDQTRKAWPSITIESEYLADLDLTTVISSLLLDRAQGLTTPPLPGNKRQFFFIQG